jgi:hypothetical protein
MMKRTRFLAALATLTMALSLSATAHSFAWQFDGVNRVVAISDVHGAYEAMLRTLQQSTVIAEDLSWAGGDTHLVIVGDLLDRGPDSRAAMDLLIRLEEEAAAAGGRVHVLIGNHEAMNLIGDLRYVSAAEYAAFAADETAAEREEWFEHFAGRSVMGASDADREEFQQKYPPGYFAHRRAFASDGEYGKWLLAKPVIVVINGTAFVHGGLSPLIAELGLDGVNGSLKDGLVAHVEALGVLYDAGVLSPIDSLRDQDRYLTAFVPDLNTAPETRAAVAAVVEHKDSDLHASDGPLWYRGNVACSRVVGEDGLVASLEAIGADRVVIGHTPTPGRSILQRMAGRIIEVDTGMLSSHYNGRGNALIIEGDSVAAISEESGELLTIATHPRRVGARPGEQLSAEDLEQLLREGDIVATDVAGSGRVTVMVSDGTNTVSALFEEREGRGFYADVAAYRLDRLLELGLVPVAVVRKIRSKHGSLQFVPDDWLDEERRSSSGRGGSARCAIDRQWAAMYVFDTLIYNEGRNLKRMMYSPDMWQLILVGHDRAFSTKKGRPAHLAAVDLQIGDAWRAALTGLDEANLEKALDGVLDKRRRRALLARRDVLVK